jgi:hypothetical protein
MISSNSLPATGNSSCAAAFGRRRTPSTNQTPEFSGWLFDFDHVAAGPRRTADAVLHRTEIIGFFDAVFRRPGSDETILAGHETIFRFLRKHPETAIGYQFVNDTAGNAAHRETVKCVVSA